MKLIPWFKSADMGRGFFVRHELPLRTRAVGNPCAQNGANFLGPTSQALCVTEQKRNAMKVTGHGHDRVISLQPKEFDVRERIFLGIDRTDCNGYYHFPDVDRHRLHAERTKRVVITDPRQVPSG